MKDALSSLAGDNSIYRPASAQPAPAPPLADMNEAVQQYLHSRQGQAGAAQAIIRLDALPLLLGHRQDVYQLVCHLFNSILAHPPAGTRLLLYVKCEIEKSEIMDLSLPAGLQPFVISVYTNIVADEAWQQQQQPALARLHTLAAHLQGSFTSYRIANTGCLYRLVLPGKL